VVAPSACTTVISLPWAAQAFPSVKGVLHQPEAKPTLKQETRDAILLAIAKARAWIDDIASGRTRSFAEIAEREGKVERHIRLSRHLPSSRHVHWQRSSTAGVHTMLP
jgi:site-specific DNA recombinase